jgi:hypothetical protein
MQTMLERESSRQLSGRRAKTPRLFMAAVEVDDNSAIRYARFDCLNNLSGNSIANWAEKALSSDCHLLTEGYPSLSSIRPIIRKHEAVVVSPLKSGELNCFRWVNTLISNVKTSMKGAYRGCKNICVTALLIIIFLNYPLKTFTSPFT